MSNTKVDDWSGGVRLGDIRVAAGRRRSRNALRIGCSSSSPRTAIGMVPTIMNHPSLASGSRRRSGRLREANQAVRIAAMSRRK
jgi:hypothetical protein